MALDKCLNIMTSVLCLEVGILTIFISHPIYAESKMQGLKRGLSSLRVLAHWT